MIDLLLEIKEKVEKAGIRGKTIPKDLIAYYEKRYKRIIYDGYRANPVIITEKKGRGRKKRGKILCLLDRLKDRLHQVLAFMYNVLVPFDNNQPERGYQNGEIVSENQRLFSFL